MRLKIGDKVTITSERKISFMIHGLKGYSGTIEAINRVLGTTFYRVRIPFEECYIVIDCLEEELEEYDI